MQKSLIFFLFPWSHIMTMNDNYLSKINNNYQNNEYQLELYPNSDFVEYNGDHIQDNNGKLDIFSNGTHYQEINNHHYTISPEVIFPIHNGDNFSTFNTHDSVKDNLQNNFNGITSPSSAIVITQESHTQNINNPNQLIINEVTHNYQSTYNSEQTIGNLESIELNSVKAASVGTIHLQEDDVEQEDDIKQEDQLNNSLIKIKINFEKHFDKLFKKTQRQMEKSIKKKLSKKKSSLSFDSIKSAKNIKESSIELSALKPNNNNNQLSPIIDNEVGSLTEQKKTCLQYLYSLNGLCCKLLINMLACTFYTGIVIGLIFGVGSLLNIMFT